MLLELEGNISINYNQITFEFDDRLTNFGEFEQIFKSFSDLDFLCEKYIVSNNKTERNRNKVVSEIKSLSKNSPFELSAFITEHWFEIFLFVWGSYDRIRPNSKLIYRDATELVNVLEYKLKELTEDFPNLEFEKLAEVLNWFNSIPFIEQARISKIMIKQSKVFSKITKIKFGKI